MGVKIEYYLDGDGKPQSLSKLVEHKDFLFDVARGKVPGAAAIHVLGNNDATSSSLEDLWEGQGGSGSNAIIPHPAAGGIQMEIVSSSVGNEDSVAGDGIQQVDIHYLDEDYIARTEVIAMNGTTPVNTIATNILRIQSMHAERVGVDGVAAGNITLESTDSATEYCRIRAGINESLKGEWTVPSGQTLYVNHWGASAIATSSNRTSEFILRATSSYEGVLLPDIFIAKGIIHLQIGADEIAYSVPLVIPATADIKISVLSSAVMETSCHLDGWYEAIQ